MSGALERFVQGLQASWLDTTGAEAEMLPRVEALMRDLVAHDDWLDPAMAQPHPQHYRQYLLHADPQDRYSVVSFVWGPGQQTPIHDHTVWGVIGMLRGAERSQAYTLAADGTPHPCGAEEHLMPGDVASVSPRIGDVHRVSNAHDDRVSISIHAYGGNIGSIRRHVFPPEGGQAKVFVSGYSNPVRD